MVRNKRNDKIKSDSFLKCQMEKYNGVEDIEKEFWSLNFKIPSQFHPPPYNRIQQILRCTDPKTADRYTNGPYYRNENIKNDSFL